MIFILEFGFFHLLFCSLPVSLSLPLPLALTVKILDVSNECNFIAIILNNRIYRVNILRSTKAMAIFFSINKTIVAIVYNRSHVTHDIRLFYCLLIYGQLIYFFCVLYDVWLNLSVTKFLFFIGIQLVTFESARIKTTQNIYSHNKVQLKIRSVQCCGVLVILGFYFTLMRFLSNFTLLHRAYNYVRFSF